jgi:molybdenum-dependent DNA-binding transcriptional regulator ModE
MLGFKHSEETRLNFKNRDTGTGHVTYITTEENVHIKTHKSIRSAAKSLGVSHTTLIRYINKKKLFKSIYYIKTYL